MGEDCKNLFILSTSSRVSAVPLFTAIVSSPIKLKFSLSALAAIVVLVMSAITLPSFSSIILSPYVSANSLSCETTITSFSAESFFRVSSTCLPVAESSAPVGSSAIIISGSFTSALAMATRCFCPPESVLGLRFV